MHTMKQGCEPVGMAYEALKLYCNQGLVPNVKRDIAWIQSLTRLKRCGI